MFIAELTTYGQSVASSQVTIDGIILLSEYVSNIDSADISQAVLDIDACGSINKNSGSVRVIDTSSNVYAIRTILFYTLSGSAKKVVAGYSQEESFVLKTAGVLNVLLPFDFSVFTNGFLFATVQSGYSNAAHNTDGVLHIENPDTNADDNYSVYSKTQVDDLISDVSYTAGDGISLSNNVIKTTGIPFGICDDTSTATKFTVTVPGIYKLEDGVTCMVKNGVVTSASGFTLNVNGLGAKPCYTNLAAATRDTTIFNVAYTMLFVYDSTRVSGGCWICYRGYDANTNTIGYQLRTNSIVMTVTDTARYYKLYFTSADGNHWVPASINSTNNATTARAVNQRPIDPFGRIVYTSANTSYAAGANLAATTIWDQYAIALGYSFNVNGGDLTLTTKTPVYVKCAPQSNGSAIMDATTPIVQTLPSSADGKIYILLGVAYDAIHIELVINHPVYYHDGSGIKLWTGSVIPSKTTDLVNDAGFITEDDIPTNVSAFTNDAGYLTSHQSLGSVVASAQYNSTSKKIEFYNPSGTKLNTDIDASAFIKDGMVDTVEVSGGNLVITFNTDAGKEDIEIPISDIFDANNYYTKAQVDGLIPTVNNAKLTIKKNTSDTGTEFTANASTNVTCNLGLATVATSGSYNDLSSKPTIPTVNDTTITIKKSTSDAGDSFTTNTATAKTINLGLSTVATSGSYNDLSNKPTIPTVNNASLTINKGGTDDTGSKTFTANASSNVTINLGLSTVASSGSYNDLSNKPTIPTVNNSTITIKKNSDDAGDSFTTNASSGKTINLGLATIATSGSYNDLSNKPTIPTVNNATLTIQKNGTTVKTFTANASSNVTANITVPLESISVDSTAQTITNGNVDLHIPADITSYEVLGSFYRNNVSGSGNISTPAANCKGLFPAMPTAGTYKVRVQMYSSTASYTLNVSYGSGNSYSLTSSGGIINDERTLTIAAGSSWSAALASSVGANTVIIVRVYKTSSSVVTEVGAAAVSNSYFDLDDIPAGVSYFTNDANYVTSSRKINNKALSSDITLTLDDVADGSTRAIPTKTTARSDGKYLYNGQTVDAMIGSFGISNSANLLNTSGVTSYIAVRSDASNPLIGLKCGTNLWYCQASQDKFYFGPTSAKALMMDQSGNGTFRSGTCTATGFVYQNGSTAGTSSDVLLADGTISKLKTVNNESIFGTGNISVSGGGGDVNVIESISINNTAQPVTNKNVNLTQPTTIDGVSFNTSTNLLHYTTCATAAGTVAKVVDLEGFTLVEGARVTVKFSATNSASNPTLNVNGTGAKAIKYRGTSAVTSSNWYRWQAGDIIDFIYDGTNWLMVGWQTYATNASVASYASYIGNSSANYVAYSNNVASNGKALLPYADASDSTKYVDLGSAAKKWRDLYVDRNAYFGRNGNASVYGNSYNNDLVIKSTGDTGDSTLGNQTSLLTLNPNYLWLKFENSSESNNVITVQKFENGSTGSRVFVNTDYIFLENGTKIVFEYQSSTAASIGRISSRTIDLNNEQVTVPDLELRLNDSNSRFIISSNWLEVAYFDRKGLTIKSQSAINNDTCEAIKLTSSETIFNKDVNLVLAKDANTYIYAGDELNGDDYRYWWTNYDQESMSYTGISISMTEETSADSTLEVPIDELSSVTPFGKLIVNTTSSSLGIGITSVTDSLKSLIESGRINTVENYVFLCFDSSSFPSNIIGVVICAELLTTSEKLMFFIQSDDLELVGYQHNPSQGPYFIVNSLGSGSYSFSNDYNFNYRIIAKTSIKDYVDDKIESRIDQGVTQAEYSTYASQVGIRGANSDASYPLLFTSSVTSSPYDSIYNNIYTDTSNDLYYNPSTNILTCATFSSNSHISNSSTYSSQTATLSKTSPASIQFYDRTISGIPIVYNQDIIINLPKITYDRNRVTRTDYGRLVINASDQSVSSATTILSPSSVAAETYFGTSLGESNSHFTSAYIDDLYVTSSGTSLLSYIQGTTVNNATHATSASYATYIRYASTGSTYQMYASSATVLRPTSGSSVDIGTSSYKYKNVYADFYNGFPIIPFGTCSSSESEDKVVTLSPVPTSLTTGMVICVQFSSTNTKSSPTLNVNSLGAKTMYRTTSSTIGTNIATSWPAGSRVLFRYSGSSWSMLSKVDYQTSTASNTNIIPSATNTYDIGSTDYKWQNLYITGGHSSRYIIIDNSGGEPTIRPDTPNYGYLGTSSADWYRIYGRQIHVGSNHVAIPPIAATTNTSLGSIQFLRVAIPTNTTTGIVSAGTTLSSSSYTLMLVTASTGYSYLFFRNNTAPSGTWTTLTDMYFYNSGSSTVYTYVLAYKSA